MNQRIVRKRFLYVLGAVLITAKVILPFLDQYTADFGSNWLPDWDYILSLFSGL